MYTYRQIEKIRGCLSRIATTSPSARRHDHTVDPDLLLYRGLDPFMTDTIKIRGSLAFTRLPGKSEVFIIPENPHVGTRLSHTIGIVNTGMAIGNILGLNVNLIEAGAYGHDIGHTAFGHVGEIAIQAECGIEFRHEIFGCIVAQQLENLNLTMDTLLCMRHHSRGTKGLETIDNLPPEAAVVMFADKIFYIWTNMEDAFGDRVRLPLRKLPKSVKNDIHFFGPNCKARIMRTIYEACLESAEAGHPSFTTSAAAKRFAVIKEAMYEYVYHSFELDMFRFGDREKARGVLKYLGNHINNPIAFFALLTDREALMMADSIQKGFDVDLTRFSAHEILRRQSEPIDILNPDLEW